MACGLVAGLMGCGAPHEKPKVDAGPCTAAVPMKHVTSPASCPTTRPASNPSIGTPEECAKDSDCTAGVNGRCVVSSAMDRLICTYDECFNDSGCEDAGVCSCRDATNYGGNVCVPSNCQSDEDCGACGYCSPVTGGCGTHIGVVGYYCHTAKDECLNDADCNRNTSGLYCIFDPVKENRWICAPPDCTG